MTAALEPLASQRVGDAAGEERNGETDHQKIEHESVSVLIGDRARGPSPQNMAAPPLKAPYELQGSGIKAA
jgi:hypothetical protein